MTNRDPYANFLANIKTIPCERCGTLFQRTNPNKRMCSEECRFFSKVQKQESCWAWKGTKNAKGYGTIHVEGKTIKSHRYSYKLHFGEIPPNKIVMHRCDNPSCVNPDHLIAGSTKENASDMVSKGRSARVENHPRWNPDSYWHNYRFPSMKKYAPK